MHKLQLGGTISNARKACGLTQAQLGNTLGVSAGAVSKWETGSALPDIALLAPLARALGITLDALLSYEPELTGEAYTATCKRIDDAFIHGGIAAGRETLYEALRAYPNSGGLKILGAKNLRMLGGTEESLGEALTLYKEAQTASGGKFKQAALFGMADVYMAQGRFEESQACLTQLAEGGGFDPMLLWPRLLIEQQKWAEATLACKSQLLQYFNAATAMLAQLAHIESQQGAPAAELFYLENQHGLEKRFNIGLCMSSLALARFHQRQGEPAKAAEWFLTYVEGIAAAPLNYNGHPFFDGLQLGADENAQYALRRTMLQELAKNEAFADLRQQQAYTKALETIATFTNLPSA